jgi:hypothetical protein
VGKAFSALFFRFSAGASEFGFAKQTHPPPLRAVIQLNAPSSYKTRIITSRNQKKRKKSGWELIFCL